ncbi:MAG: DUF4406 domain-containing protein [Paludibacteraceae bacterium]
MKSIYISLPITGQEDSYEARLNAAVAYVKAKYPEYERIVTPKELAEELEIYYKICYGKKPSYKDYLLNDIEKIRHCDAIFMCRLWSQSKGCQAEYAFAQAIGLDILWQPL